MLKTIFTATILTLTGLLPLTAMAQITRTLPVRHVESLSALPMPDTLMPKPLTPKPLTPEPLSSSTDSLTDIDNATTVQVTVVKKPVDALPQDTTTQVEQVTITPVTSPADVPSREQVQTEVAQEIAEQRHDDINTGEVVANASTSRTTGASSNDESAITSIVSRNGKTYKTTNLSYYAQQVNNSVWTPNMNKNSAMTVKLQTLLDWNHASPGPIDGGWGMNSMKALKNFQVMRGLEPTGRLNQQTWDALISNVDLNTPIVVEYTLTAEDVNTRFANTPSGAEAKSKMSGLYYQNIKEMLGERFHMDVRYLDKLNAGKSYRVGETITVLNVGKQLDTPINKVVASKADETLYAYYNDKLVATYPTTVGSSSTPSPHGTFRIVNKVKMPWYKATVGENENKQVFMLPPGPNNPVGVVWMGLSKPSYGIHGSPIPEGISRQASHGCIRLTNWDVLEVYANIENGATVELV